MIINIMRQSSPSAPYAVTIPEQGTIILQVGQKGKIGENTVELYDFMGITGLDIATPDGLYSHDITASGYYTMYKVEDLEGEMYNL